MNRYSYKVMDRTVRMVLEHEKDYASRWSALSSISSIIGCTSEALRNWVKRVEADAGRRLGVGPASKSALRR